MKECPFRYQGQYEDRETGLYYNRFRYYSPEEGMYISQDPLIPFGGLIYGYVSNPNQWLDILGLKEDTDFNDWIEKGANNNSVYLNGDSDEFDYVGITNDVDRRSREHAKVGRDDIKAINNTGELKRNEARCIEEAIIVNSRKQGISTTNKDHSIDPKRNIHPQAVQWGEEWIKNNNPVLAKKLGLTNDGCP